MHEHLHASHMGQPERRLNLLAGGKSDTSGLEFTYAELGSPHKAPWTLHGASGAFAGAEDEVYAVLSNSGLAARVFPSQASAAKPAPLRRLEVGAGGAVALFSGPSWPALPTCAPSRAWLHFVFCRNNPPNPFWPARPTYAHSRAWRIVKDELTVFENYFFSPAEILCLTLAASELCTVHAADGTALMHQCQATLWGWKSRAYIM